MVTTWCIAHAGCEGTIPNSMDNLEKALALGCDYVEVDVRMSNDSLVLSHDPVEEMEDMVREEQLVSFLKEYPSCKVNLDLKEPCLGKIISLITTWQLTNQVMVTGTVLQDELTQYEEAKSVVYFNIENLLEEDQLTRLIQSDEARQNLLGRIRELGVRGINMNHQYASIPLVTMAKEQGIDVIVWTVDTKERMEQCLSMGVTGITTNQVHRLQEAITKEKEE